MAIIKKATTAAGSIVDRSIVKALAEATSELLPKGATLPAAAIETLIQTIVHVADTAAVQMADRFAAQIVGRLADSRMADALADKVTEKLADEFAARFTDPRLIEALAAQFAAAFSDAVADTTAVVQLQRPAARGKRRA
jgi:hypothetical protein